MGVKPDRRQRHKNHDDYKPIGGASYTALSAQYQQAAADSTGQNLYNGNISTGVTSVSGIGSPFGTTYHYDQLNRLTMMRSYNYLDLSSWSSSSSTSNYKETLAYDGNGNIRTYIKSSQNPVGSGPVTNAPVYSYPRSGTLPISKIISNRLKSISDPYGAVAPAQDISTQYGYDAIGNLISDTKAGITNIDWTVYGKIKTIYKAPGNLDYTYDPAGQRASKSYNGIKTWYVRDASGNTMAIYDNKGGTTNWREQDLYGSSRLGIWTPNVNLANNNASTVWDTIGHKQYELTNHLGNVLATITDKRLPVSGPHSTITYYLPDLVTAQLYYSFGAIMPSMNGSPNNYRYGFNGKENDNEVKQDASGADIAGAEQDYGMRIYDPRVGRFLSVDPIAKSYPMLTPYQFASNRPIDGVDQDGLEWNGATISAFNENAKRGESPLEGLKKSAATTLHFTKVFLQGFWQAYRSMGVSPNGPGSAIDDKGYHTAASVNEAVRIVKKGTSDERARLAGGMAFGALLTRAITTDPLQTPTPLIGFEQSILSQTFESGGTKLISSAMLEKYPNSPVIGNPAETFIAPSSEVNALIKSGASRPELMKALGIEDPKFLQGNLMRVDVSPATLKNLNLRMPSGNEIGANNSFIPGGKTSGGVPEGVVNGIPKNNPGVKILPVGN